MKVFLILLVLTSFIGTVFAEDNPQQLEPTPSCPEGTIVQGDVCVETDQKCGKGTTYQDGICVVEKSPKTSTNSSGKWGTAISFPPGLQLDTSKLSIPLFDYSFSITEKQVRYDVFYDVTNGSISNVQLNCNSASLTLSLLSSGDGTIQLDIPKGMLGGIFMVLVDDEEWDDVSIDGNVLTINFIEGTSTIEVVGSYSLNTNEDDGVCDVIHNPPHSYIVPPLMQFNSGISLNEIQCKENLILLQKYDGSPACVTNDTSRKLVERGWATCDYQVKFTSGHPCGIQ